MAKKRSSPDQKALPGFEVDVQKKLDFGAAGEKPGAKPRKGNGKANAGDEHLPPNLAKPVQVRVPDFSDPKRPKTCLEVDFPIVPINALSALEGNAGKPIYQMSKWWARRRSCVFRAMLIAAAMEAPVRKNPDGTPVLDDQGLPVPDETETAKAVWDVYYANHQKAGNFKHLRVLDCFMGGGTTLVEGSRLGFQLAGVDLNPVAWFVTKNELAGTDPEEVKRFFDQIEAEVKPVIQPFYVTDCPRGHKGRWYEICSPRPLAGEGSGVRAVGDSDSPHPNPLPEGEGARGDRLMPPDFDPLDLPPEERKKYRYEGPEVIYTFWAKHGPCTKPGCGHRTPVFRSPVIAEKRLGVKYVELKCKECKTVFHAELGDARMAPAAEQVVLPNEGLYTALSQPFAKRLSEYGKGRKEEKKQRAAELYGMVDEEPGLKCPKCGAFAGQYLRDILNSHQQAATAKAIDKKDLRIQPPRNSTKPVYCYLLIHPDWLRGSPGSVDGQELGGYPDAPVEATSRWYEERLKNLRVIEVRGRIKLSENTSHLGTAEVEALTEESAGDDADEASDAEVEPVDRKEYGLPRFISLADGRKVDTGRGTVPRKSAFTCRSCGQLSDFLTALKETEKGAPVSAYVVQGYCPQCDTEKQVYGGRFFGAASDRDVTRLKKAQSEWDARRNGDLVEYWPNDELPPVFMTHHNNGGIPNWGYTHFFKMFNARQLLLLSQLLRAIVSGQREPDVLDHALGCSQQYLRNQNMFCIYDIGYDKLAPFFSNANYAPKALTIENTAFGKLGRGNWTSCVQRVIEGVAWGHEPSEAFPNDGGSGSQLCCGDAIANSSTLLCQSSTELPEDWTERFDLVITDPPFGNNLFYGDLANYFHVWLRPVLEGDYPQVFGHRFSPRAQECVADRSRFPREAEAKEAHPDMKPADVFYEQCLEQCWEESRRVTKDGGLMAFTFHHSADAPWQSVLRSLFDAGWILEATIPIRSD